MEVKMQIPYVNGSCVTDFNYGKEITRQEYVRQQTDEWRTCRVGVNTMMPNLGYNIAINSYQKRSPNIKPQKYSYYPCNAMIYDIDENDIDMKGLTKLYEENRDRKKNFMLYIFLNPKEVRRENELVSDLKQWFDESEKMWSLKDNPDYAEIDDECVLKNLPTKDFKMEIPDSEKCAVLKNCKFIERSYDPYSFVALIEQILFINNKIKNNGE